MAVGAKRNRCKRAKISALARRASAQRPVGQQLRTVPIALGERGACPRQVLSFHLRSKVDRRGLGRSPITNGVTH